MEEAEFQSDYSNEFYSLFLDSRLVYSAADFSDPGCTLDEAQASAVDAVCRKLHLKPGDRFLDFGCGWGALVLHAARNYGVSATGCSISPAQVAYCQAVAPSSAGHDTIRFELCDCREVAGDFDKISAIGLIEHLGTRGLAAFLRQVNWLLAQDGLFLSRAIIRTESSGDLPIGRELATGADLLREGEKAGLEPIATEEFHTDYARTCRVWADRLRARTADSLRIIDETSHSAWLVHLEEMALSFEQGRLGAAEVLWRRQFT